MVKTTAHCYIVTDSEILNGGWGYLSSEIPKGMPHLTLAQVFDALSYYSDNIVEINRYIELNRIPYDLIDPLVII